MWLVAQAIATIPDSTIHSLRMLSRLHMSVCLSFLRYKMGLVIVPQRVFVRIKMIYIW